MTALAFALAFAGFAAIGLAMERHHGEVFGTRRIPPLRGVALRWLGWLLLGLSFVPAIAGWDWSFGPVAWCGVLTLAAGVILLLLPWRPRLLPWLAAGLPVLGVAAAWV